MNWPGLSPAPQERSNGLQRLPTFLLRHPGARWCNIPRKTTTNRFRSSHRSYHRSESHLLINQFIINGKTVWPNLIEPISYISQIETHMHAYTLKTNVHLFFHVFDWEMHIINLISIQLIMIVTSHAHHHHESNRSINDQISLLSPSVSLSSPPSFLVIFSSRLVSD